MTIVTANLTDRFTEELPKAGFQHLGGTRYQRGNCLLELDDLWGTFSMAPLDLPQAAGSFLDTPGLWKRVLVAGEHRLIADIPLGAFQAALDAEAMEEARQPVSDLLDWVLKSLHGDWDITWQPPEVQEIETWLGPQKFTVQSGRYVGQAQLECAVGRCAVHLPLIPALPPELSSERRNWIKSVVNETQDRFRMVRVGFAGPGERRKIVAEFDLSGAPHESWEALFTSAMAALRGAVRWSAQSLGFLADPTSDTSALEAL